MYYTKRIKIIKTINNKDLYNGKKIHFTYVTF